MITISHRKSGQEFKPTFRDLIARERQPAAEKTWAKAVAVSRLRHAVRRAGKRRQARVLGAIKASLIKRTLELVPEKVTVAIDQDYHVGLFSIRWPGHGRLHLPASTEFSTPRREPRRLAL